jgi:hypothetical protein
MSFNVNLPETFFVDESGNSGLNANHNITHPFLIMGFAYSTNPFQLKFRLTRLLKKLQTKQKWHPQLNELKFFPFASLKKMMVPEQEIRDCWAPYFDEVRTEVSQIVTEYTDGIFAGVLDKRTIFKTTWTPEKIGNYLFKKTLFDGIIPNIKVTSPEILYDKGRIHSGAATLFNQYIHDSQNYYFFKGKNKHSGLIKKITDVDSLSNSGVWAADIVAGAFHKSAKHEDNTWTDIMKPKFIGNGFLKLW